MHKTVAVGLLLSMAVAAVCDRNQRDKQRPGGFSARKATVTVTDAMSMDFPGRLRSPFICMLIGSFIIFSCVPCASASAEEQCSLKMHEQAVSLLKEAGKNWQSLSKHQKRFAVCDDGALGEGYSDAVAQLLSRKWDQFGSFVAISRHDPAFKRWTIGHIDATASYTDLSAIVHNASVCSNGEEAGNICKVIQQAAKDALLDSGHAPVR
jgi:hypothetical protein